MSNTNPEELPDYDGGVLVMPEAESTHEVHVLAAEGKATETAQALLAAAADNDDRGEGAVRSGDGGFYVPKAVYDAAELPDGTQMVDEHERTTVGADDERGDYTTWKKADLQAEVKARNKHRESDAQLATSGTNAELAQSLADDDAGPRNR